MKYLVMLLAFLASCSAAQAPPTSYWLFLDSDGRTWCGYANAGAFDAAAANALPTETARVTYSGDRLAEITYQVAPESGDWMVIDKYEPEETGLSLVRANLLVQEDRKIVQETSIRNGVPSPLHIVESTTLDGRVASQRSIDYPEVPVRDSLSQFSFLEIVEMMRNQSISSVCKELP